MFRRKKEETMIPWDITDRTKIPDEPEKEVTADQQDSPKDVQADQQDSPKDAQADQQDPPKDAQADQQVFADDPKSDLSADGIESDTKAAETDMVTPAALVWAKAREKAQASNTSLESDHSAGPSGPDVSQGPSESNLPPGDIPQEAGQEPVRPDQPTVEGDGSSWVSGAEENDTSYSDYYSEDGEEEDDYTEEKPKKKEHGPVFIWFRRILLTVGCFVAALLMTFVYSLWSEYTGGRVYTGNEIQIEIPKGTTPRQAAEILQDAGAIHYKSTFLAKVLIEKKNDGLKYGSYKISKGDSLDDIVNKLTTGSMASEESRFTIPEGYSIEMIADRLEQGYGISGDDFLKAVDKAQKEFVYADQLPSKDKVAYPLQGYLFPDTYHITKETTADQLVSSILKNFDKVFDESRQKKAKKLGLSVEDVLIMASLVQKESYNEDDYPAIAGVINNRLDKGMKLQFDSTVVYAISDGKFGVDRVTYKDLDVDSPYNTYHIKGLPPGPICNPGLKAIDAVLNPDKHDYLYFRADPNKDDGSNIFSKTYEEHMAVEDSTDVEEITKKDQSSEEDKTKDSKSKDSKSKETKTKETKSKDTKTKDTN